MKPFNEFLIEYFGNKPIKGIEIGVQEGINSENFIKTLNIEKLYLIDPYTPYTDYIQGGRYKEYGNVYARTNRLTSKQRFKDYNNVQFIYKKSEEAISDIIDICDFVYIDGEHSYPTTKKDIEYYSKIIKNMGVVGGDDYISRFPGVIQSVDEFIKEQGYKLNLKEYKTQTGKNELGYMMNTDWWFIK